MQKHHNADHFKMIHLKKKLFLWTFCNEKNLAFGKYCFANCVYFTGSTGRWQVKLAGQIQVGGATESTAVTGQ